MFSRTDVLELSKIFIPEFENSILKDSPYYTITKSNKKDTLKEDPMNTFWTIIDEQSFWTIHHQNHNFSCFKTGQEICRFKLPARTWNQISGIIQLVLDDKDKCIFHILKQVESIRIQDIDDILIFTDDPRYLTFVNTKRSSDEVTLRDPTILSTMKVDLDFIQDDPDARKNGLVSPCNPVILVTCGGGGLLHNNLQLIHKGGMGDISYIAKYFTKGSGQLREILPLVYEVCFIFIIY